MGLYAILIFEPSNGHFEVEESKSYWIHTAVQRPIQCILSLYKLYNAPRKVVWVLARLGLVVRRP